MNGLLEAERSKYERMHAVPGYSVGPGISHIPHFLQYLKPGESVIDFGCGTGDAAKALLDLGHDIRLVDIVNTGLSPAHGLDDRLCIASLTNLPDSLRPADWGFCCDVMEHLPTEWVPIALAQMRTRVEKIFFSISGHPDSWGKKIGETLHLTVQPCGWWMEQIGKQWNLVSRLDNSDSTFVIVGRDERDG